MNKYHPSWNDLNPFGCARELTGGQLKLVNSCDELIRPAVKIMLEHGFLTSESCQGGKGHSFPEPTICFEGTEFDLIIAYELCTHYKLNVSSVRRIYVKNPVYNKNLDEITENWIRPYNEIVFHKSTERGTIFLLH